MALIQKFKNYLGGLMYDYMKGRGLGKPMLGQRNYTLENELWYIGKEELLVDYYKIYAHNSLNYYDNAINIDVDVRAQYFYSKLKYGTRIIHSGFPYSISDTKSRILFERDVTITTDEIDRLEIILEDNKMEQKNKEAARTESWAGSFAYKIVLDKEFNQYPIVLLYNSSEFELKTEYDRILEIIFLEYHTKNNKKYVLKEHYGFGYIEYKLFQINNKEEKEVPLSTLPETANLEDVILPNDTMLAMFKPNNGIWGISDYDGQLTEFDAIDEIWSSLGGDVRKGKTVTYIPDTLQEHDINGNLLGYDYFDTNILVVGSDETENAKNELKHNQPLIRTTEHKAALDAIKHNVLENVGLSPTTLGMGSDIELSGKSRAELEKATIRTRNEMIKLWKPFLEEFYELLLIADDILNLRTPREYEVIIDFDMYVQPSKSEKVADGVAKREQGLISKRRFLKEVEGMDDDQIDQELKELKNESAMVTNVDFV